MITQVIFKPVQYVEGSAPQELLITTSADQTIKIWNLTSNNFKAPTKTLFDHEEEIVSATVAKEAALSLFGSVDREGCVIIRDLKQPDYPIAQFKPEIEEPVDTACVAFNNHDILQSGLRNKEDLFVALNNQLFVYCLKD